MTTILFDTDCVLCARWVQFVLKHERQADTVFMSAWSEAGRALAAAHGLSEADLDETLLVIVDGAALTRSDAILAVLAGLRAPWSWGRCCGVIPRALRDWAYGHIARRRYRLFGRRDQCFVPPAGQAHRFVSAPLRAR